MTSVMIVHDIDLVRGALAAVLSHQPDIDVIAQLTSAQDVAAEARAALPDVVMIHVDRCTPEDLEIPHLLATDAPHCAVLLISDHTRTTALRAAIDAGVRGFLSADAEPTLLVDTVRRLAAGERVIDPALLTAALRDTDNPLTQRQRDVLRLAAEGFTSTDIGRRLFLSPGTVRNYLSAAIRRTGGRSVLEAAGRARTQGWL